MTMTSRLLLICATMIAVSTVSIAQDPKSVPATETVCPTCGKQCGPRGVHWTDGCFPRCGCCDDYCPRPLPRQCVPCYPPFYKCVPAGDGCCCCDPNKRKLSCWFLPTPRALKDALWFQP
jgi:hypothetical protein